MNRKRNWSLLLFAAFTLLLGSCSPLMPAAYPNPPSPIPAVTSTSTLVQPTPTLGPVMDLAMPTSRESQIWIPVDSEQVTKNEKVLALARPLLEKARSTYITPGWLYIRSKTETFRTDAATLPDGTPIPTHWQDESWKLIDESGQVIQSVKTQDTGEEKTSTVATFQNGIWKHLTYGTSNEAPERSYPIWLDGSFIKNAEDGKNLITLEYDDTQFLGTEKLMVFTLIGPKISPEETISHMRKYYFSMETGLLLQIEEYRPSTTGDLELSSRTTVEVVEKVEQPPAEAMKYFE